MFNPAVNKDIIDKADFLQFWGHLHTLFYMIDEDGGIIAIYIYP